MIEQTGKGLAFYAHFIASKIGKTGLTPTVDVWRVTEAGVATEVVTAASATEIGDGIYRYLLAAASVTVLGEYVAVFKTVDATVDQQHIPMTYYVGRAARAVWDEATAGHTTSGTAGAAVGRIGAATVTVVSPVSDDGTAVNLVYGDDYYAADSRQLTWQSDDWPVLTGATVALRIQAASVVSVAGTVLDVDEMQIEIPATTVATIGVGTWRYDLQATLVTSAHVVTLATGYVTVEGDVR